MKSVVITGATGTIGMALINKCIKQETEVLTLVNPASSRLDRIPESHLVKASEAFSPSNSSFGHVSRRKLP